MIRRRRAVVGIRTSFVALHYWKDAPDNVSFLICSHRHVFNVTVELAVDGLNRQIEFFTAKAIIDKFIKAQFLPTADGKSCEMMAKEICEFAVKEFETNSCSVVVQEDEENYSKYEMYETWEA